MGLLKLFHFTSMYFMSLCYALAQSKVLGKGGILDFCRIVYILLSPMLGWAGIREECASVLISYTPTTIPGILCIVKPRKGKSLSNITYFFLTHALKKHCGQLLPERTSLYMRDLENGGAWDGPRRV
jgi:hypothetical protein